MERSSPLVINEYYHVYNRGVNKNKIFFSGGDWKRFQHLMYTRNATKLLRTNRIQKFPLHKLERGETVVDIVAYSLMPNHYHFLLHEKVVDGISTFMKKLGTAYAMYINKKYDRSGPLMCRPFRSKYIDSDEYMRWCISYIHSNPLEMNKTTNSKGFLGSYQYSSYIDYYGKKRSESCIVNKAALPFSISSLETIAQMRKEINNGVFSN